MVRFYVNRILAGKMTIADVPAKWRGAVEDAIRNADSGENDGAPEE